MVRRINFILICVVIGLTITLIFSSNQCKILMISKPEFKHEDRVESLLTNFDRSSLTEATLQRARSKIREELLNYNFTHSGVHKLEDLVMECGGTPLRSLVVSAWRSGSTFFAELLNAMPGNFYHYEPLLKYKIQQIRGPPYATEATHILKNMLLCNYSGMDDYFEYGRKHLNYLNQFEHNKRLWEQCKLRIELCFDADFTARFCKLFPFQSMKVVRYRLKLVEDILEDERLNVKVLLLVRDPRGVLQSRRYRHYCQPSPDCIEPRLVCQDMVSDYIAAAQLREKYPGRIMALRFEDIALNLNATTHQIYKFLKLGPTKAVSEFLHTHTNAQAGGIDSTFRITRNVPFKWKKDLDFEYVHRIQDSCREAMQLWGYRSAHNASHMASEQFYPLLPYTVKVIDQGIQSFSFQW